MVLVCMWLWLGVYYALQSKLSLGEADLEADLFYALLEVGEVVLEPEFFVLDDADEFDELVVLLLLLADVLLAE